MPSSRKLISTGSTFETGMGYSRAVVQGDWCFVSGVTGYDYRTMTIPDAVSEQAQNCFETIDKVLNEAGFELADIVRVNYILTDVALLSQVQPVLQRWLEEVRPAATMIIAGLIDPKMCVEIEVTAFKG